jgi:hypothetical protein
MVYGEQQKQADQVGLDWTVRDWRAGLDLCVRVAHCWFWAVMVLVLVWGLTRCVPAARRSELHVGKEVEVTVTTSRSKPPRAVT